MRSFIINIFQGSILFLYAIGLLLMHKNDRIGDVFFSLFVPFIGQLYGVWAGFKYLFP